MNIQQPNVFLINGYRGTGKDEFVKIFSEFADFRVINLSTIDPVKDIAKLMGWNGKKEDKDRNFLADLKKLWVNYNDELNNQIIERIFEHVPDNSGTVVFVHVREPEQIELLTNLISNNKQRVWVSTIFINRPDARTNLPTNSADTEVENYIYDFIVDNTSSIDYFRNTTLEFMKNLEYKLKHNHQ